MTGERIRVSRQGAQCLRWRAYGKELYYLASDGQVYAVPLLFHAATVQTAKPEALFTIDPEAYSTLHSPASFDVSPDGSRFVIPSMTPGDSAALVVLQEQLAESGRLDWSRVIADGSLVEAKKGARRSRAHSTAGLAAATTSW